MMMMMMMMMMMYLFLSGQSAHRDFFDYCAS